MTKNRRVEVKAMAGTTFRPDPAKLKPALYLLLLTIEYKNNTSQIFITVHLFHGFSRLFSCSKMYKAVVFDLFYTFHFAKFTEAFFYCFLGGA